MRIILSLIVLLNLSALNGQEEPVDWEYWKAEVLSMKNEDQQLRKAYGNAKKKNSRRIESQTRIKALDSQHNIRLHAYIDSVGSFPSIDEVGEEVAHAFWILTMHQDSDLELQKLVLAWMKEINPIKNFIKRDIAFLMDRIAINEGRCQTYGTQFDWIESIKKYKPFPICNEKKVDKQRKRMKLIPLEKQNRQENR